MSLFEHGFPEELHADVQHVSAVISSKTYNNVNSGQSERLCRWALSDGRVVYFPYRIYFQDGYESAATALTPVQKSIYSCIFSRSYDGFIREKHIKSILSSPFPPWAIPYIVKVCDEYVIEILDSVYGSLKNTEELKAFCKNNVDSISSGYDRMVSYWNTYYRQSHPKLADYVGQKLYSECFGF